MHKLNHSHGPPAQVDPPSLTIGGLAATNQARR